MLMSDDPGQPTLGQHGGKRTKGHHASNRSLKGGTNRAYVVSRLRRDGRDDLVGDICSGELSAFAAAVVMGWVTRRRTVAVHSQDSNQARRRTVDIASLIG